MVPVKFSRFSQYRDELAVLVGSTEYRLVAAVRAVPKGTTMDVVLLILQATSERLVYTFDTGEEDLRSRQFTKNSY